MEKFEYVKACVPQNVGWIEAKLSDSVLEKLSTSLDIAKEKNIDYSSKLVGHLDKEISIIDECSWFLPEVLSDLMRLYTESFSDNQFGGMMSKDHTCQLHGMWANFQKKNDFNQLHFHGGAYSFVVFWNIPTIWEEQNKDSFGKNKNPCISDFVFVYTDTLGLIRQHNYRLNPSDNGKILFFPARMLHMVHPFYDSDDYRITISGNIGLDSDKVLE